MLTESIEGEKELIVCSTALVEIELISLYKSGPEKWMESGKLSKSKSKPSSVGGGTRMDRSADLSQQTENDPLSSLLRSRVHVLWNKVSQPGKFIELRLSVRG